MPVRVNVAQAENQQEVSFRTARIPFTSGQSPKVDMKNHPEFEPSVYSLDAMIPLIELGQVEFWQPKVLDGKSPAVVQAGQPAVRCGVCETAYHSLPHTVKNYYPTFHTFMGWLLVILLALSPTRILRRE